MTTPDVCVIFNPSSGKKKNDARRPELLRLIEDDPRVALCQLDRPQDLEREVKRASAEGFSTVIAAGGDGTISGVAGALVGNGARLGIVPMGTFNFLARSLDIPEGPAEAMAVALDGADAPLDVGEVNGRIFLNNASLGAYAAVLDVREGVYKRWGRSRIAAYWSVVLAMLTLYRPLSMRITIDGTEVMVKSPMAFIASSAYQLEQYDFEGTDAIRDGKLALFVAPDTGRLALLWKAVKILFGGVRRGADYRLFTGREIVIETRRARSLVARDGERERMAGPYRFRLLRDAVTVKVPHGQEALDTAAADSPAPVPPSTGPNTVLSA